ncbi:MAG: hypothetical protein ACREKB_13785 [Candidatus Rokuibacteriota bacterium]
MESLLRVRVTDDTLERLQARADEGRRDLELTAQQLLALAVRALPPSGRVVCVGGEGLQTLEAILGGGSILNQDDLLKKVERLAGISFLHCRLPFTPNQLEALAEKAARNSLTVEQLVERTAPRIYEHFFDLIARV